MFYFDKPLWHDLSMKFRNPFKSDIKHFITKEAENALYKKAAEDMDNNIIDKGIWTRAFAKAQGNKLKQKAFYIELIVEHYKDLIRAGEELATILATEEQKRQKQEVKIYNEKIRQQELKREQDEIQRQKEKANDQSDSFGFLVISVLFVCGLITIAVVGS